MKCIAAVDRNWAIGKNNKLLVSIPADMRFFKEHTMGKTVIMGRATLESFPGGKPLKGRVNIVVTRDPKYYVPDAIVVHSVKEAAEVASRYPADDVYVIGGASIYRQFLRCATPPTSPASTTRTTRTPTSPTSTRRPTGRSLRRARSRPTTT